MGNVVYQLVEIEYISWIFFWFACHEMYYRAVLARKVLVRHTEFPAIKGDDFAKGDGA